MKSFPRHLKLRSLELLILHNCSKLQTFPEIECKMKYLCCISLFGTPIKELPSSIGYLTPALKELLLGQCTKLMRLPSTIHQLQNLKVFCFRDCINGCFTGIERSYIEGCKDLMRLPISVSHSQHQKSLSLDICPNLAQDELSNLSFECHTGLKNLHLTTYRTIKRSEPELSAELPRQLLSSLYWYLEDLSFYCPSTLQEFDLSRSAIVSLPPNMKRFVELRILRLTNCEKLQEILQLPPNIQELDASNCFSLERCPEVSTKFQFYTCGLRELRWIDLSNCHKLVANIGSQVPNPSFVEEHIQDHSCGIIFLGNKIPDWFSHTKEISNSHSCELDISGPLYLEEIIGIIFCAVLGSNPDYPLGPFFGICVSINGNMLVEARFYLYGGSDHVYLNYSFPEWIEQFLRYPTGDNLRLRFCCDSYKVMFKSCGVHIIYKHEENENLTVGECSVNSSNGIQLSKRRRDDGDNNLEFNGYPQHKRHSQDLSNSNATQSYSCQPSHAQITPSSSFNWSEFLMSEPFPYPGFRQQQDLYFKGVSLPTNYPSTLEQTPQLNYDTGNYNGLNRIGHEGGFETFDFGSTSGAQTNNWSEALSFVSSFVEAIREQDSEMPLSSHQFSKNDQRACMLVLASLMFW